MRRSVLVCVAGWVAATSFSLLSVSSWGLAPPNAVEAIAQSDHRIRIYWDRSPGAVGYEIERNGQVIAHAPSSENQYTDRGLAPGTNYLYTVLAETKNGASVPGRPYLEQTYNILPASAHFDLIVVAANSAGVAAAYTAGQCGLKVALLEETDRLGGMPANGLGQTDMRYRQHANGFFEQFRRRVQAYYGARYSDGMQYQPRVAQQIIKEMLYLAPNLTIFRNTRVEKVRTHNNVVTAVLAHDTNAHRFGWLSAPLFVDATDCGDIAAWAGAPFHIGREPRSKQEPHNGFIYYDRATDERLPGSTGRGDKRVQSYAYLITVKKYPSGTNHTIPKPKGYNEKDFIHALPWKQTWAYLYGRLPDDEFEINQHPVGNDLQGINYKYPTAGYVERAKIAKLYYYHALDYLYYIETALGHPNIGLATHEFRDNRGMPPLLYVREGRRIMGLEMPNEWQIWDARQYIRPNGIGIAEYPMDSHAAQPKKNWSRPDFGEGEFYLPQYTPWSQLPYGVMLPRKVHNLWVAMAVSSTHVAFGTYRLEAERMSFGEAAGFAAYICHQYHLLPREVPVRLLQRLLESRHYPEPDSPERARTFIYWHTDIRPFVRHYREIQWVSTRDIFGFEKPEPLPKPPILPSHKPPLGVPFNADKPVTIGEATNALNRMAARMLERNGIARVFPTPADPSALLTRREAADMVVALRTGSIFTAKEKLRIARLPWDAAITFWHIRSTRYSHYVDIALGTTLSDEVEALYRHGIDSLVWDGTKAMATSPDPSRFQLRFQPQAYLTRGQYAETLYLASVGVGPLFYDDQIDVPWLRHK